MKIVIVCALLAAAGVLAAAIARAPGSDRSVAAVSALPPDLQALPASQLSVSTSGGIRYLRLSATSWNGGAGKLHLVAGETDPVAGTQIVYQRVFNDDGSY